MDELTLPDLVFTVDGALIIDFNRPSQEVWELVKFPFTWEETVVQNVTIANFQKIMDSWYGMNNSTRTRVVKLLSMEELTPEHWSVLVPKLKNHISPESVANAIVNTPDISIEQIVDLMFKDSILASCISVLPIAKDSDFISALVNRLCDPGKYGLTHMDTELIFFGLDLNVDFPLEGIIGLISAGNIQIQSKYSDEYFPIYYPTRENYITNFTIAIVNKQLDLLEIMIKNGASTEQILRACALITHITPDKRHILLTKIDELASVTNFSDLVSAFELLTDEEKTNLVNILLISKSDLENFSRKLPDAVAGLSAAQSVIGSLNQTLRNRVEDSLAMLSEHSSRAKSVPEPIIQESLSSESPPEFL